MKKIEMDCFEITETDGGGMHEKHIAYVSSKSVADAISATFGGWANVRPYKKAVVIVDTVDEYNALKKSNAREAALAKLTEADKKALDL